MALISGFTHNVVEVQYSTIGEYVTYYLDKSEINDSYANFGSYVWYVDRACTIPVSSFSSWQALYDAGCMIEFKEEKFFGVVYYGVEEPKPKKFLDINGVQQLYEHLSLSDYPNNETLVAVLNAIDETKADKGHVHNYYGICTTSASVAEKTVQIDNFELVIGAMVLVKFEESNSASNPTLNVSGTGAKPMYRYGTTAMSTGTTTTGWSAGAIQVFIYDGTGWTRDYWNNSTYSNASLGNGYGTCSTAASTKAKTASLSNYALSTGGSVSIKFTNSVPAEATLNINSKGAKAIYYRGAAITDNIIKAGDVATFIYSGTYYHLVAIDRWQEDSKNMLNEAKAYTDEKIPSKVSQLENDSKFVPEDQVKNLFKSLNSDRTLRFYCIEDVTVVVNGVSTTYPANSNVEVKFIETDVFEIIPSSNNSILALNGFPGALGTYYSWLEGVKQFSNILFDMNDEAFYSKWSQGNQGAYQVQYAQYINCIFWSDNPYISDVSKRTNYTLYYTSQLPLCYSSIPENTFKAFYLAFNVNSDPNWGNKVYRDSFAKATWATQVFSYYGARTIGIFGHDDPDFNITLPKDCRGLMYQSTAIENAGTFDAINTTNFGATGNSWQQAFGQCSSLRNLFIKNLKVNLNVSWSPLNYSSISFIIANAANTTPITISLSPYTYYLLNASDFELATSKNITINLVTTNYVEDKRFTTVAYKTGDGEFSGDVIAGGNGGEAPVSLKSVNNLVQTKADADTVLLKTEQTLTDEELTQVRKNLKFIGKDVEGQTFTINGKNIVAAPNAEIFGDYLSNKCTGQWSIVEGSTNVATGRACHVEGAQNQALNDGCHVEGVSCIASGYWSHAEGEMTRVTSYASHAEGSYTKMPDGSTRYGTASGYASHIEGGGCYAQGSCSHSEGLATTTKGNYSHSEGRFTIAGSHAQHVEGIANIEDATNTYIHIAGNGDFGAPSNAYTLDWDGNGWFSGDVYVNSTSGTNKDGGSKKLATEEFVNNKTNMIFFFGSLNLDAGAENTLTMTSTFEEIKKNPNSLGLIFNPFNHSVMIAVTDLYYYEDGNYIEGWVHDQYENAGHSSYLTISPDNTVTFVIGGGGIGGGPEF